jgi:hypothetical protein
MSPICCRGQFVQPFIDAAFSDLGVDPNVLLPSQLTDPETGQPGTPALPMPYPRTGQGGEPSLTVPDAITGNPGDARYPYIIDEDFAPHVKGDHEGVVGRFGRHLRERLNTVWQHFERGFVVIGDVGTPEDQAANAFRDDLHHLADDGACVAVAHRNEVC